MSKTIGKATLEADEDGLVTLQCNRCRSRFKVNCTYLNNDLEDKEIYCPVCGISEELNTFWPEEIIEEAEKVALVEAERMITDALKGINSKFTKVKTKSVQKVDTNMIFKNKDYDMQKVKVHCCNREIALMPADVTSGFYCPYCGRIVK